MKHAIKESFDLQDTQLDEILQQLEDKNLITVKPIANGFYLEMKKSPLTCDPEMGLSIFNSAIFNNQIRF